MHKFFTKKFVFLLLYVSLSFEFTDAAAASVTRVEPAYWWIGMKNKELQLMVYGPAIAKSTPEITYPGVTIKEVARTDNPNYLFVYLTIDAAKPGIVPIKFSDNGKVFTYKYELKARTDKSGALGFSKADVLYLLTPDRFANGNIKNDNWDNVNVDRNDPNARHGGDLQGVAQRLDYIKDLGFTTVWFNPVQENKMPHGSYHGYAITDFYKIDQRFGTNEDFKKLTATMHAKGMKVVMDMIFNHCGSEHPWMKDKPAADWINNPNNYVETNHAKLTAMDTHAAKTEQDILLDGWFVRSMPDLNQRNRHLATYLIQNSIWWIEYARIDGIRQDTYPYPDYQFMARWCKEVMDEYPNFNIVGESWYGKSSEVAWWQRNSSLNKNNSYLKTVMDFPLTFASEKGFSKDDNEHGGESSGLYSVFEVIAQDFLYADPDNILTFLDNHDLGRFARKEETDLNRFKQAFAFLLTTRGIPQIYYGTEILMVGTKNEGDGSIRKDFPGGWPGDKTDAFTAAGRTRMQNEAFDYLKKLLNWRKNNDAVINGKLTHYAPSWNNNAYVYARISGDKTVLVILNGSGKDQDLDMARYTDVTGSHTTGIDVITGKQVQLKGTVTVPARGEYILELN
ncbi:alpha-amylase [Mucilaginibacter limnophilus]|uniref:Alpha-amylase n=1 Tax=Mucilaginibacter limnophilus TaxID=1932778 RepID=A0A3S2VNA2_9SPHI|nr:glycoside hydrolase family 13 protein [Mucilaginibacter limnophilus]RVU01357.1 alpha-amylase [Mucilaginibacter limnophilus]